MDTIRFQYKYTPNQHQTLLTAITSMCNIVEKKYKNRETLTISGQHNAWHFTLTPNYLYGTGSLPQLLYGTNLVDFTINDTRSAIIELNKLLGVDVSSSKITRLDFGYNIIVSHPVHIYLKLLGHKAYCRTSTDGSGTLKFKGKNQEFIFYEKISQLKNKGEQIPDEYADKNVLRYEMKLTQDVAKKLGYDVVKLADLTIDSVYQTIKNKWYNEYTSIDKLSFNIPDFGNNVKQFKDYLMIRTIERDGLAVVYKDVDAMFKSNYKAKGRMKKELKRLAASGKALVTNIAAAELEDKITEVMEVVY